MPTYCLCDRFFEAFKGVEHAAPDNWQNLTAGPTMSLMTVDLRMPNCRYRHACTCLTVTGILSGHISSPNGSLCESALVFEHLFHLTN